MADTGDVEGIVFLNAGNSYNLTFVFLQVYHAYTKYTTRRQSILFVRQVYNPNTKNRATTRTPSILHVY